MGETYSRSEIEALWRERLRGALRELNSATLRVHEAQQEYYSRAIPSPDGDHAFRRAVSAETVARREYMNVLMTLQNLVLHGKIPSEHTSKKKAIEAASGRD
jgi:hypothetical protein